MVHSFSDNYIYGLRLNDIDLGPAAKVTFNDSVSRGVLTFEDFFRPSEDKTSMELYRVFRRANGASIAKRKEISSQIHTGNLAVDLTNPILQGTFSTFIAENTFTAKKSILYKNMLRSNPDSHFVYLSPNRDHIKRFMGWANEANAGDNTTIFDLVSGDKTELWLLTKLLPHYLNYLRDNGKNAVLIVEDIEVLYMELYGLLKNDPTDMVYTFIREVQSICCNTSKGSISAICFKMASSSVDIQFQRNIDNLGTELALLSSAVVDSADKNSKKGVKSALAGLSFKPVRTRAFSALQSYLSNELFSLMLRVN